MTSTDRPERESRPHEFLLHSPLLTLLVSIVSISYWDILYLSPPVTHMIECTNLWVTKFTRHCRKQGPQSSMIKNNSYNGFPPSPFTQERSEVQKGIFPLDMAFTWFCISSKAVDTFSDRSGMYTQHSTLTMAQVPPWAAVSMSNVFNQNVLSETLQLL